MSPPEFQDVAFQVKRAKEAVDACLQGVFAQRSMLLREAIPETTVLAIELLEALRSLERGCKTVIEILGAQEDEQGLTARELLRAAHENLHNAGRAQAAFAGCGLSTLVFGVVAHQKSLNRI